MNDIEVSSIDLVEGGNVFKQGHYLTLGYVPRDEKGETVDLSGKTLNVSLWGRKGVVFEAAATYSGGVIRFTFDKLVAAGDYTVEFTATSSTDAKYRKKFPTNQHSGRIAIKQSADDLGVVGIQVYTVAQLKAEQKALLDAAVSGFTVDSETKMARVSGSTTYTSLPARLEADKQATALQLAETLKKSDDILISQLSKNGGLLDESYLSPALKSQITGTTAISPNLGNGTVNPDITNFMKTINRNLFNKDAVTPGLVYSNGTIVPHESISSSPYIEVNRSKIYYTTPTHSGAWYDKDKVFISVIPGTDSEKTLTPPANAFFMRIGVFNSRLATAVISDAPIVGYSSFGIYEVVPTDNEYKKMITKNIEALTVGQTSFFVDVPSLNLLDETKSTPGTIVGTDGKLVTSGAAPNYFATDFIPVTESIAIQHTPSGSGSWYDSAKAPISGFAASTINRTLTPPVGAKFVRLTFANTEKGKAMVTNGNLPSAYISFADRGITLKTNKQTETLAKSLKPFLPFDSSTFKFKEWNAIGDSITEVNSTATKKYHDVIKEKTGVVVKNYGYSGTGYLQVYNTNKAIWDRLDELSPTADLITVFAGTNDKTKPIGVYGDIGTTTIYGAIDTVFRNLVTKFPTKTIAAFTPLPRDDSWSASSAGTTIEMIADAIIKVAGKYSIPVLDLYRASNLYPWNVDFKTAMMPDGLHPNNTGHAFIADKIYSFLNTL